MENIEQKTLPFVLINESAEPQLSCSTAMTVQPNVLLRTGVFTPVGRTKAETSIHKDLTEELRHLEICHKEGYDRVLISGSKLNVETDFRVWCGIILAFSHYGQHSNEIELSFAEFARMCGYPARRFDAKLRRQIDSSLARIRGVNLSFQRRGQVKSTHSGLLYKAKLDENTDTVVLLADPDIWDLYTLDFKVLVSMKVLSELPRAEVAQCLYLYFLSLPADPHPISFTRMRERLQLSTPDKEANRRIKLGIEKLEDVGFVTGFYTHKEGSRETYYKITSRDKRLGRRDIEDLL